MLSFTLGWRQALGGSKLHGTSSLKEETSPSPVIRKTESQQARQLERRPSDLPSNPDKTDREVQHGFGGGLDGSSSSSFGGAAVLPSRSSRVRSTPTPRPKLAPLVARYKSLLKACIKSKSLARARRVYADLTADGLELSKHLGEAVVCTLVKCGGLEDGLQLFRRLPKRTVVSWTAVISGFSQTGQCEEALRMYGAMAEEGVQPNAYTVASVLKACGAVGNLEKGKCVHADAMRYGYDSDLFVGTSLVDMYAKCGSMADAQTVFDGLCERDVVSWTTMLRGCAQKGQGNAVLQLFLRMREEGVSPNDWTLVSAIQACCSLADKEDPVPVGGELLKVASMQKGKALHAETQQRGFDSDLFIGSSLVCLYAKCGSMADAQAVFDRLSNNRNVVIWTTMVAAYVERSQADKALLLYEEMHLEAVTPNAWTVVSVLQACCTLAEQEDCVLVDGQWLRPQCLHKAKAVCAEAKKRGDDGDSFVGSAMINLYGKCGSTVDAEQVFYHGGVRHKDVVSWTAMQAAYVQQDLGEKALHVYAEMQKHGVCPSNWTFVSALQACGSLAETAGVVPVGGELLRVGALQQGMVIHAEATRRGCSSDDVYVGYALVSMYGKCGSIRNARLVFDELPRQDDVVAWNAMLAGYSQQGLGAPAQALYERMRSECVSPDDRTFVSVLQACCSMAEQESSVWVDGAFLKVELLKVAKSLHAEAQRYGYESDIYVANTLVSLYGKCGSMADAQAAFDGLSNRDVVTWNAILSAYGRHREWDAVLELYSQMVAEGGVHPDDNTLVEVLQACGNAGALPTCAEVHKTITSNSSVQVANALIQAYGKCSRMDAATAVFASLAHPTVVSWNELIAGYSRQGNYETSLRCYEDMLRAQVRPDAVTFLYVLTACSHAGLVDKGVDVLGSMEKNHGVAPEIEHYCAVVDLLGRAGLFAAVEKVVAEMPVRPDVAIWKCVLSACRKHGNVVLAKRAFDCAVDLQPNCHAAYALMSQIYGQAGMWVSARRVEQLRVAACGGSSTVRHPQEVGVHESDESVMLPPEQQEQVFPQPVQVVQACAVPCM